MKIYLAVWPHGAQGDPRDIGRAMRIYLVASCGGLGKYVPSSHGSPHKFSMAAKKGALVPGAPLRLLLSYHYYKDVDLDAVLAECFDGLGVKLDLFADSGAYSAWSQGAELDVKDYAVWLRRWRHLFTVAASLDAIGDGKKSVRQTLALRDLKPGVPIMPVFHSDDGSWEPFHTYIREGYDYIGLSPTGLRKHRSLMHAWIGKCFAAAPPGIRFHGFGRTGWADMRAVPWTSVDSSSWTSAFRYASVSLFDRRLQNMEPVSLMPGRNGYMDLMRHAALLEDYGLRPSQVRSNALDKDMLTGAIIASWQRAEAALTAMQERRARAASAE